MKKEIMILGNFDFVLKTGMSLPDPIIVMIIFSIHAPCQMEQMAYCILISCAT